MLRKEALSKPALELLTHLMHEDILNDFFLVGETALSLQIGHRISIDLDLFSVSIFDENKLLEYLENKFQFKLDFQDKNTLKGEISGVKVDCVTHAYPLVKPLIDDDGIRLATIYDIAAMKLNAIVGNGTRLKDFVDIAYLSSSISLAQMVHVYQKKYSTRNPSMVIKALSYHQDIDFSVSVQMVKDTFEWDKIKSRINQMTLHPQQLFPPMESNLGATKSITHHKAKDQDLGFSL